MLALLPFVCWYLPRSRRLRVHISLQHELSIGTRPLCLDHVCNKLATACILKSLPTVLRNLHGDLFTWLSNAPWGLRSRTSLTGSCGHMWPFSVVDGVAGPPHLASAELPSSEQCSWWGGGWAQGKEGPRVAAECSLHILCSLAYQWALCHPLPALHSSSSIFQSLP